MEQNVVVSLESRFEGSMVTHFFYQIVKIVFTIGSGSLLYPLTVFLYERWLCSKSYVEGFKLKFVGTLIKVYLIYIVGLFFAGLTSFLLNYLIIKVPELFQIKLLKWGANAFLGGINTLFITTRVRMWKKANTVYEGNKDCNSSKLQTNIIMSVMVSGFATLANIVTLGLFIPLATKIKAQYFVNATFICGQRLFFVGKAIHLYKKLLLWIPFIVLTLGGFLLYISYYFDIWEIENTIIKRESK